MAHTITHAFFGDHSRYCLSSFRTRFGDIEFQVTDAELEDEVTGKPALIRQETNVSDAVKDLGDAERAVKKVMRETYA